MAASDLLLYSRTSLTCGDIWFHIGRTFCGISIFKILNIRTPTTKAIPCPQSKVQTGYNKVDRSMKIPYNRILLLLDLGCNTWIQSMSQHCDTSCSCQNPGWNSRKQKEQVISRDHQHRDERGETKDCVLQDKGRMGSVTNSCKPLLFSKNRSLEHQSMRETCHTFRQDFVCYKHVDANAYIITGQKMHRYIHYIATNLLQMVT